MKLGIPKAEVDKLAAVRKIGEGSVPHTMLVLVYDSIKKHGVTEVLTDMLGDEKFPCELSIEGIEAFVEENAELFVTPKSEEELEAERVEAERVAALSPEELKAEQIAAATTASEAAEAAAVALETTATEARAAVEGAEDVEAAEALAVAAESAAAVGRTSATEASEALAALTVEEPAE